jgi:hypothetical protein
MKSGCLQDTLHQRYESINKGSRAPGASLQNITSMKLFPTLCQQTDCNGKMCSEDSSVCDLRASSACLSVLGCCFPLQPGGTGSFKCRYSMWATSAGTVKEKFVPASCSALTSSARSLEWSRLCALRQAFISTPRPQVSMSVNTFTCPKALSTSFLCC